VPLGSPAASTGPFLEGGDTLLNGHEIYVGMSGCASDMAGIDWLQALLGALSGDPGRHEVERAAPRLRLALVKPAC
jgi:N-dimethylarginine dimethylaminohydrolase